MIPKKTRHLFPLKVANELTKMVIKSKKKKSTLLQ